MNEPALPINGALLRQRREAKGWAQTDLATRACLSLRQVRQIEDGGNSSFYSESVKATAARKIATLLGLSSESAFVQAQAATDAVHTAADGLTPSDTEHAPAPVVAPAPRLGQRPRPEAQRSSAGQRAARQHTSSALAPVARHRCGSRVLSPPGRPASMPARRGVPWWASRMARSAGLPARWPT
jgi:transcriptional regulator with XRE-family HTH domain